MSSRVDLHLHTTASDGRLSPADLVALLARKGIEIAAITDHDTTAGLPEALEAARSHPSLRLLPGVELSTDVPRGEVHLLAYCIDLEDRGFQRTLERFRRSREERARKMVEKLVEMGLPLEWERVRGLARGESVGRPHIAQALVERGYVGSLPEAFEKYLGRQGPAYVEREKLAPEEAVRLVVRARGLPVLAHPWEVPDLEGLLGRLTREGLVGMEVYYAGYTPEQVSCLLSLARRYDLLPLGGSDYHAFGTPGEVEPGEVGPPVEEAERLLKVGMDRGCPVPLEVRR